MYDDYTARCALGQAWLLEEDGGDIGVVVLEVRPERLFIHNVVVAPEHHHRGVGRTLLQFVEDEARRRG